MMRRISFICILLTVFCFSGSAGAGDAAWDMTGEWSFRSVPTGNMGPCPPGREQNGTATVAQTGNAFTLQLSGIKCSPPQVCSYKGMADGKTYKATLTVTVDDEGGKVKSDMTLTAESDDSMSGQGVSVYSHPSGMTCRWEMDVTMIKTK